MTTRFGAKPMGSTPLKNADNRLDSVEGIILAGEYHWTGSSFQELRPRPLLPVAQTALVEHVLRWLSSNGVARTTMCANGSTHALRAHLKDGRDLSIDLRYYEDGTPRGAAGCVKDAASRSTAQTLIVADGASIPVVDIERLIARHRDSDAALTIVTCERESKVGGVRMEPAGVYVFEREILEAIPATSFQDIKENLIPKLYRTGRRVQVFPVREMSPHVLSADSYLALNQWMIARLARQASADASSGGSPGLMVHPTAWIDPDALVCGPVLIGPGVRVEAGAAIVGPASVGEDTRVGRGAVVARSVTWKGCDIGEDAVVDHSIMADGAAAGRGETVSSMVRTSRGELAGARRGLFAARRESGAPKLSPMRVEV